MWLEVSLHGKCIRSRYFWSIIRGGLCWEGSLNGGITVYIYIYITFFEELGFSLLKVCMHGYTQNLMYFPVWHYFQPRSLSDRFGVLSTVHLETSRKDWERRAKPMLLHLVPTKDDSGKMKVCLCENYIR